jgi:hypothetical protein
MRKLRQQASKILTSIYQTTRHKMLKAAFVKVTTVRTSNLTFENILKFKYQGTALSNGNIIYAEIRRINSKVIATIRFKPWNRPSASKSSP